MCQRRKVFASCGVRSCFGCGAPGDRVVERGLRVGWVVDVNRPGFRWRLLTLETRMESCQERSHRGSRRRVGTPIRRRRRRSGWSASCVRSWARDHGTVKRVAEQLGYGVESVRAWVRQADIDEGRDAGDDDGGGGADQGARAGEPGAAPGERDPEVGVGFLRGGARPPTALIVDYIDAQPDEFGVEPICAALQFAPSTYYAAKTRPLSARAIRDAVMMPILIALWTANYEVYGARKMWKAMRRPGHDVGRDQVARLMREPASRACVAAARCAPPRPTEGDAATGSRRARLHRRRGRTSCG